MLFFRPMTAYMLFFRDTYTAVKNTHPLASFGDVSKIAAGMWDSLDDKTKEVRFIVELKL